MYPYGTPAPLILPENRTVRAHHRPSWCLCILTVAILAGSGWPSVARAATVDGTLWGVDGSVDAIARSGSTLYIGGAFSSVGPCTGSGVPLDLHSAARPSAFPKVAGKVYAAIGDGAGGWYVGGDFVGVGGQPRCNLAHILANGSVDPWSPTLDGPINCLVRGDQTLYVGGVFHQVAGAPRECAAAFNVQSGSLTAWNPTISGVGMLFTAVNALLSDGQTVFVGGDFALAGGQAHRDLVAVDANSGAALPWGQEVAGAVLALELRGNTLYVGGYIWRVGGALRNCLAALDVHTGTPLAWNPDASSPGYEFDVPPYVSGLVATGNRLFVAGHFSFIGGQPRGGLAELDGSSGQATAWNPNPVDSTAFFAPVMHALAVRGQSVYVGGEFLRLGGQERFSLAAIDARTGLATAWNPRANNAVRTVAIQGDQLFAGGLFSSIGEWVPRNCLAAIDLTTGRALPWNPAPDGFLVRAVGVSGGTVYVGGEFGLIGKQLRRGLAAVDALTGQTTSWDPHCQGSAYAVLLRGGTVYVGGRFDAVGGASRNNIAALDSASALARPWDPSASDIITALAADEQSVYAGGWFGHIGGRAVNYLAALDPLTGAARGWAPSPDDIVDAVVVHDGMVYAGGAFRNCGGANRDGLVAVDASSGALEEWNPSAAGEVDALEVNSATVFAGGFFSSIGSSPQVGFAAIDRLSGMPAPSIPSTDGAVFALDDAGGVVYVGGAFSRLGLEPRAGLAAVHLSSGKPSFAEPVAVATLGVPAALEITNPARTSLRVQFSLPQSTSVSLGLFDLQGRRVAVWLDHQLQPAGRRALTLDISELSAGCYLSRFEAGATSLTRKVVVIR